MRVRDQQKQNALFDATVKIVNEIGFASSSVAKISAEAGVSPATLYIYHANKEELLIATYVRIKQQLSETLLADFDPGRPIRETLQTVWRNGFAFAARYPEFMRFAEQFSNSPYSCRVDRAEVEQYFQPIIGVLRRGIAGGLIKDVGIDLLVTFVFYPLVILSNERHCKNFKLTRKNIDAAFELAWDAIRR